MNRSRTNANVFHQIPTDALFYFQGEFEKHGGTNKLESVIIDIQTGIKMMNDDEFCVVVESIAVQRGTRQSTEQQLELPDVNDNRNRRFNDDSELS